MSGFFEGLGRFATRHRRGVIAVYFLLSAFFLWRGSGIRLETSLAELLPRDNRAARDFRDLLEENGTLDRLLVSVSMDPSAAGADGAEPLVAAADAIGGSLKKAGLASEVRYGVDEEDLAELSQRAIEHLPVLASADRAAAIGERLRPERIRERVRAIGRSVRMPGLAGPLEALAARDPLGLLAASGLTTGSVEGFRPDPESGLFLSADGRSLLMVIRATQPPTRISFSRKLIGALHEAEEEARRTVKDGGSLRFDEAGGHLFALEDERRIRHDAMATSIFSVAGIALIYLFVIRRPILWLVVLIPLSMTTVWTLGLASIYPGRLNMITVAFAAILLGIGDDAMIHMYLRERHERAKGLAAPESVVAALSETGRPVTVATLSSAAAFLSLSFVEFRGLAELGIIAAIGMLTLLAGVLVFFPASLAFMARRESQGSPSLRMPIRFLLGFHDWSRSRRTAVLGTVAGGTVVMLFLALQVGFSTDLRSIRGEDPAAAAMKRVMRPFEGGASEMMVILHGSRGEPPTAAAVDAALEEAERLRPFCAEGIRQGILSGCDDPSRFIPPLGVQRERYAALGSLPWTEAVTGLEEEARNEGMDPAFFAPFTRAALKYGDFDAVRVDPKPSWFAPSGMPRTKIFFSQASAAAGLAERVRKALGNPDARIASVALVSSDLGRIIASDFRLAAVIVAVAIALLSLAAFRTVGVLLVTLTPVALGTVWLLGTARLFGVELNLMSMMGMPVVFGLGVDYGVYVVDRWSRGDRDPREALGEVGPAVLVTGLTTLAGFAALLVAELAGLRSLGFAVVTGTGYTLAAALLVLPLLLPRGRRTEEPGKTALAMKPRSTAGAAAAGSARSSGA